MNRKRPEMTEVPPEPSLIEITSGAALASRNGVEREVEGWLVEWEYATGEEFHCWVATEVEAHHRGKLVREEPIARVVIERTVDGPFRCVSGCLHINYD